MSLSSYSPSNFEEWHKIMEEKLNSARCFEIHIWEDEEEWLPYALKFGSLKEDTWSGFIVEGIVTSGFKEMILNMKEPEDKEIYDKFTPFFSIFLDSAFSSEHYGTELSDF